MFSNPATNVDLFGLMPGMKVADLGAGVGFYALPLARAVGGAGKVYAVDVQKDLLAKLHASAAAAHITNIETVAGDIERRGGTGLADGSMDAVVAANVLFQMAGPVARKNFLSEAMRILRSKGRVIVVEWSDSFGGIGPHPHDVVSEPRARELGESMGLSFESRFRAGDHHYGIIFKKP